jgi:protein-S-isoprenylcysteine O-methyltransferase
MMQLRPLPFSGGVTNSVVFWVACTLWVAPEIIAAKLKRSPHSSNLRDRGSLKLIAFLWWLGISADVLLSIFLPQTNWVRARAEIFTAGICLMMAGTAFRWYSAAVLGKYFTFDVSIQSGHALIQRGPYRYIRHPSYTGALVTLTGFGLTLGNWAGLIIGLLCLGSAYAYRIPIEEAALLGFVGEPYSQYVKKTWRLVPFVF